MRVRARIDGEVRPIARGASLRSGDRVEVEIEVSRPAYVYIVQFFGDGSSAVLFPTGEEPVQIAAGSAVRLPGDGQWFELDDNPGDEHVYVAASSLPLERADAAIADAVRSVRTSSRATATRSRARRRSASGSRRPNGAVALLDIDTRSAPLTRGLITVRDTDAHEIEVRADESGLIVLHFPIRHLRRR